MGNLAAALIAGLVAGRVINAIAEGENRLAAALEWTGVFSLPTAWDHAWMRAAKGSWAAVELRLAIGEQLNVLFDKDARVGLSPEPREAFFATEYRWDRDERQDFRVLEYQGIFVHADDVISIRFEHIEP